MNVCHHKYKVYYYVLRRIIFLERKETGQILMLATVGTYSKLEQLMAGCHILIQNKYTWFKYTEWDSPKHVAV